MKGYYYPVREREHTVHSGTSLTERQKSPHPIAPDTGGQPVLQVYRHSTHTDCSHHPAQHKRSFVATFMARAKPIPTTLIVNVDKGARVCNSLK